MYALGRWMRLPIGRAGRAADGASDIEPPLRAALFSGAQLESHARSLASDRTLAGRSGREMLLHRLAENETIIRRSYEDVAKSVRQGHPQTPAAKWLVDPDAAIIRLFDPPFDGDELDPGYIRGYIPGVRENGGQYTHAALWAVMAVARLGRAEEAWRLFAMLNPVRHADTPEKAARYKVEPYVVAADVYSARGHEGRGGWTWYTGSAAWMYRLLVEDLLGLRLEVDTLTFAPLLPDEWPEFTLHYRYRNTRYHIRVVKTGEALTHVQRVTLDGIEQPDKSIHLVDDGQEHPVVVEVGDAAETER